MPRDAVIEARLDSRDLATCAKHLTTTCGINISSNSELIWLISQLAVYAIGGNEFEEISEARAYLTSIGLDKLNRSGRNKATLQRALQVETLNADGFSLDHTRKTKSSILPRDVNFDNLVRQAMEGLDAPEAIRDTIEQITKAKQVLGKGGRMR